MLGMSLVLELFFKWDIEETRTRTMAEARKKANKSLVLFLRLNMADVWDWRERTERER